MEFDITDLTPEQLEQRAANTQKMLHDQRQAEAEQLKQLGFNKVIQSKGADAWERWTGEVFVVVCLSKRDLGTSREGQVVIASFATPEGEDPIEKTTFDSMHEALASLTS